MLRRLSLLVAMTSWAVADLPMRWVPTEIGGEDGTRVTVADLDDNGRVVGTYDWWDGSQWHQAPFFWQDGQLTVVPTTFDQAAGLLLDHTGRALGIEYDNDILIRIDEDGLYGLAELGPFTGYGEIIGISGDFTVAGNLQEAGFVWTPSGGVEHISEGIWDRATVADIADSVGAVGTIDLTYPGDRRAFRYIPQGGGLHLLYPAFEGETWGVAVNEDGRVLVIRTHADGHADFVLHDALGDTQDLIVHSVSGAPLNLHAVANDAWGMAMTWNQPGEQSELFWWGPGMFEAVALDLPTYGIIGYMLQTVTQGGEVLGAVLNEEYQFESTLAKYGAATRSIRHAVIGWPAFDLTGPIDINLHGQMLMPITNTQGWPALLLNAAMPGDTDGDGVVDADDVLSVIAAWGPHDDDDPCGPDLDLDGSVDTDDLLEVIASWSSP